MGTLWAFLAAAIGPLAVRVLIALGISVLTVQGVDLVLGQLVDYVVSGWGGLPANVLMVLGLAGVGQAAGLILGAVNARAALWALTSATRWAVKGA